MFPSGETLWFRFPVEEQMAGPSGQAVWFSTTGKAKGVQVFGSGCLEPRSMSRVLWDLTLLVNWNGNQSLGADHRDRRPRSSDADYRPSGWLSGELFCRLVTRECHPSGRYTLATRCLWVTDGAGYLRMVGIGENR